MGQHGMLQVTAWPPSGAMVGFKVVRRALAWFPYGFWHEDKPLRRFAGVAEKWSVSG
jgi:hypothetical protein